jgi:hypothetical protein
MEETAYGYTQARFSILMDWIWRVKQAVIDK